MPPGYVGVSAISKAIDTLDKKDFLIPYSARYNMVIDRCIDFLNKNDYAVIRKPKAAIKVKDNKGLVDLYYHILFRTTNILPYRDDLRDFKIAKYFVKKIQDSTGLRYEYALVQCVNIVEGLFKYKKHLNLEIDILRSFTIFGQDKLAWITESVISLLNKELYDESLLMAKADTITEIEVKTKNLKFGFSNLEEMANEIRRTNGKKERD